MKPIRRFQRAFALVSGLSAFKRGDYARAVRQFDRIISIGSRRPHILGFRAMSLMLCGDKAATLEAFGELATLPPTDDPDDEYARKYAQMYIAYLQDDLIEADKLAEKLSRIPCRGMSRRILIPIPKPSELAVELYRGATERIFTTYRTAVEAHFADLRAHYSTPVVRVSVLGTAIKPDGSP